MWRRTSRAREALPLTDESINAVIRLRMAIAGESTTTGISFALTDEQRDLQALAHDFAAKEIRPQAAEHDEHQTHPAGIVEKAHALGLMNVHIPEELAAPGLLAGTNEQKREWLPPLLDEPLLCSFALTEPNAGSDVSGIQTTAVRHGDEYVINGSKMFISNAGHAAWIVVFASTNKSQGQKGLSAFVVPADADGVVVEKHLDKMGQRATDTSALAFQDVKVPAANRLGEEGEGFKIAMRTLDHTRPGTAIGAVGVARAAYELSIDYSRERVQFGQPIAMNQGVNFLIADMAAEIEAARLLTWQAAWLLDQGKRATLQSSCAKRFASDMAMKVTTDAVQIFGGYGYMKEYPVEKLMRDAKLFQIYEGTSQIQRLAIAREIFFPRD